MYRMLFTNARASALFAGAIVLLATAFAGGQDAGALKRNDSGRAEKASVGSNADKAAHAVGSDDNVDMAFMEDEELIQSSEGDEAGPDELASTDEIAPQDPATPEGTEQSDPASMEPDPDVDPSAEAEGM